MLKSIKSKLSAVLAGVVISAAVAAAPVMAASGNEVSGQVIGMAGSPAAIEIVQAAKAPVIGMAGSPISQPEDHAIGMAMASQAADHKVVAVGMGRFAEIPAPVQLASSDIVGMAGTPADYRSSEPVVGMALQISENSAAPVIGMAGAASEISHSALANSGMSGVHLMSADNIITKSVAGSAALIAVIGASVASFVTGKSRNIKRSIA